jgi:hypothetical protein
MIGQSNSAAAIKQVVGIEVVLFLHDPMVMLALLRMGSRDGQTREFAVVLPGFETTVQPIVEGTFNAKVLPYCPEVQGLRIRVSLNYGRRPGFLQENQCPEPPDTVCRRGSPCPDAASRAPTPTVAPRPDFPRHDAAARG